METKDKKRELLVAAYSVFQKYGFRKTTLDDIASSVRMQKSSLYYYFKSKDDLFREMVCMKLDERVKDISKVFESDLPIRGTMVEFITNMKEYAEREYESILRFFGEIQDFLPVILPELERFDERINSIIQKRLRLAVEQGELEKLPVEMISLSLLLFARAIGEPMLIFSSSLFKKLDIATGVDFLLDRYYPSPDSKKQ